jgi:regulator of cell morphogenesis and NO signaling
MTGVIGDPATYRYDAVMKSTALSLADRSLGDIVKDDSRAAAVLARYGLDFCCGGHQTLADAASRRDVPVPDVVAALGALGEPDEEDRSEQRWPELDGLTRHIVAAHHHYVREITPTIAAWLDKLVIRHGERHPELAGVRDAFGRLAGELAVHMVKEESVLFPYIDELAEAIRSGARLPSSPFGTVLHPVRVMEEDHREAAELLDELRGLTSDFTPPADACPTYRSCFAELERFEGDLKTHVHLENHVLFPRAIELEQRLI